MTGTLATGAAPAQSAARTRAQSHFAASEQRDSLVKQIVAAERAAIDARSAKLKALRLAKEEADRQLAQSEPPKKAAKARKRA